MKWIKYGMIMLVSITLSKSTEAQLLKKLKEKAGKAVEGKGKAGSNSSGGQENNSSSIETSSVNRNATAKEPAGPPANGKVVFSLAADEQFLYDETAVSAENSAVKYQFVIRSREGFFLVENGTRTGPFKVAPIRSRNVSAEYETENNNVSIGDNKDEVAIRYTKTIGGKLYIVFNGKNFGPYDYVSKMMVSPNQKNFFAVVTIGGANSMTTKMGIGNTFIVNGEGLKYKIGSGNAVPMKFYVSEGFTHAMAAVMDQTDQKIYTATTAGKQTEGSMADLYAGGEGKMFVSDKGDIISIPSGSPRQILVNGIEAASFKVPIESISRLTITPDVSRSVYYTNGKLYKADGDEIPMSGILFPKVITSGNKTVVYYFKVYKNEAGVKDVYLCSKDI
ncbi:MAG: hypothetical protein EOO06_06425 [Chitinophagaceae bacterium]|nr:MAG: hypothetical protein EOO06_06425 [Chitinophagaceae bacterium]